MSTRVYYVLKRDTVSPYLAVSGGSFCELGKGNFLGEKPKEFLTVREAVVYLRSNNVPDVTRIMRVVETIPNVAPKFEETEVG